MCDFTKNSNFNQINYKNKNFNKLPSSLINNFSSFIKGDRNLHHNRLNKLNAVKEKKIASL